MIRDIYVRELKKSNFSKEQLSELAKWTFGYPYLYHLVGFYLWNQSERNLLEGSEVLYSDEELIASTKNFASLELFKNVYSKAITAVSPNTLKAIEYLVSLGGQNVPVKEIREHFNWASSDFSRYRNSMIDLGFVESRSWGTLSVIPPYLQEFFEGL
ncbi:MAG: hypothetical protein LBM27_02115 [Lactobacillaceae bacterium]|jgi:hypothetical protein|nr:hypothetical protein [Lactobacillaceae bacterium]